METIDAFAAAYPLDILIADYNVDDQKAMKTLLTQLGYAPDEATSDSEVLRMAAIREYDVILMDIRIPGIERVIDAPRSQGRMGREPAGASDVRPILIAIAAVAAKDFRTTTLQARMDSSLTLPMDRQELLLQLKACSVLAGKCCVK